MSLITSLPLNRIYVVFVLAGTLRPLFSVLYKFVDAAKLYELSISLQTSNTNPNVLVETCLKTFASFSATPQVSVFSQNLLLTCMLRMRYLLV